MSRTVRKQAEWTLPRALDELVLKGAYPAASDDIVVQSVEERIGAPVMPVMFASLAALRGQTAS